MVIDLGPPPGTPERAEWEKKRKMGTIPAIITISAFVFTISLLIITSSVNNTRADKSYILARRNITSAQVVNAYLESWKPYIEDTDRAVFWPYEILQEWTGQPEYVCLVAMEIAINDGYIVLSKNVQATKYESRLSNGWITDKGYELINKEVNDE